MCRLDHLYQATVWHVEERNDEKVLLVLGHHGGDDNFGYVVVEPHEIHFYPEEDE